MGCLVLVWFFLPQIVMINNLEILKCFQNINISKLCIKLVWLVRIIWNLLPKMNILACIQLICQLMVTYILLLFATGGVGEYQTAHYKDMHAASQSRMTEQVMVCIVISVLQYIFKLSEVKCLLSTALGLSDFFMGW